MGVIEKRYDGEAGGVILRITPFTLNDTQRRYPALKRKEAEGWWTGSIQSDAYTLFHLPAQPTVQAVAAIAVTKLAELGIHTTVEEIYDGQCRATDVSER